MDLADISGLHIQSPESAGPRPKSEYEAGPSGTVDLHPHQPGLPLVPGPSISESANFGSNGGAGSSGGSVTSQQQQQQQVQGAQGTVQHHPPAGSTVPIFNHGLLPFSSLLQLQCSHAFLMSWFLIMKRSNLQVQTVRAARLQLLDRAEDRR